MSHGKTAAGIWHEGEVALQRGLGVDRRMAEIGARVVRDHMPEQHRAFFAQLPFLVVGAVDRDGDVWATLLGGPPGFARSPDPKQLRIGTEPDPGDPAAGGLRPGDAVGLLGIELHTRRRNRMNGRIAGPDGAPGFAVTVEHSFGNCPQYIQLRDWQVIEDRPAPVIERFGRIEGAAAAAIARADTFFVASYADLDPVGRQVDVSHRGGKAGFVRQEPDGALTIPDFAGNLHFNTLGNILLNPRAGLVFPDFETGDLLQLTGEAELLLDAPEIAAFQGAERLWRFRPRHILLRRGALPLRFAMRADGWSPNSLMTGSWAEADARLAAEALAHAWRPYEIAAIEDESATIRSFDLVPADGKGLIAHKAGQHLPIRLHVPGQSGPIQRTYTLSVAPSDGRYRISVKQDGLASAHLHGLRVGDRIEARGPAGAFTIDALERRPAVLIGAGIGITPMIAMLRHVVYEGLRTRRVRPTWLIQSARNRAERAFDREIDGLAAAAGGAVRVVRLSSRPGPSEAAGRDHDVEGRFGADLLRQILPFDDYDFYLCGPSGFMQAAYDGLRALNVADRRIFAEAFGPSSLVRMADAVMPVVARPAPAAEPVPVAFAKSGKEVRWTPADGSLLELAEARGLSPAYSCRAGSCGSCAVKLLAGTVAYRNEPTAPHGPDEVLLCSAVPAANGGDRLILDV